MKATTDDIYIMLSTSQFLVDFIEEKMGDKANGWIKYDVKYALKNTIKKLTKVCDLPFEQDEVEIGNEVADQAFQASLLAEMIFKVVMQAEYKLDIQEQFKFQLSFENLCTRFGISLAEPIDAANVKSIQS